MRPQLVLICLLLHARSPAVAPTNEAIDKWLSAIKPKAVPQPIDIRAVLVRPAAFESDWHCSGHLQSIWRSALQRVLSLNAAHGWRGELLPSSFSHTSWPCGPSPAHLHMCLAAQPHCE